MQCFPALPFASVSRAFDYNTDFDGLQEDSVQHRPCGQKTALPNLLRLGRAILVHLSDHNYKNYQAILRFKRQLHEDSKVLTSKSAQNRDIDKFGEIVTKSIIQAQKHLTSEEIDSIAMQYQSSKTLQELAKEYGCCRGTVCNVLKKRGVKIRGRGERPPK